MHQEHEYALLGGMNRSKVGRYIGIVAAVVSAALVFIFLSAVDLAAAFGFPVNIPPAIMSLAGAAMVFTALYWLFDKYLWRVGLLGGVLRVPNLSGEWTCKGKTYNRADNSLQSEWVGTVTIVQSWDRLRVRLRTPQSGSNSITAALACDEADGYHLLYNYVNDPKVGEADLKAHRGFAQLTFAKDRQTAEGEYFNGFGRDTYGKLELKRA